MSEKGNSTDILLVEDNPHDVELILHVFSWCNLSDRVHVAWDGKEALDFIFGTGAYGGRDVRDKPKVIFLDLKLPKVDGIEVLRRLKMSDETRTIPVVVLTSSSEDRDILESYSLGANSYVVKPVNFDQFAAAIRELGLYWRSLNLPPRKEGIQERSGRENL
ncbi:MAG: response regulator [Methanomicrobiales archaeon]|nr:response regulator [Methanomicrobiales archaeon]MDI6877350.1 response regulator [Methanomicrobiales archaeon]